MAGRNSMPGVVFKGTWPLFYSLLTIAERSKIIYEEEKKKIIRNKKNKKKSTPPISKSYNDNGNNKKRNKTETMKKVLVMGQLKEQIIPPPTRLVITLRDFRASNIMLVIEKTLFWTDVSSSHARFSIPKNQVRSEFLTDEEKVKIERELLEVKVLDPEDQWWDLHFKQWKMEKKEDVDKNKKKGKTTYTYVLSRYWKNLVNANQLKKKIGKKIQFWSFRIPLGEGGKSQLCFTFNIVK